MREAPFSLALAVTPHGALWLHRADAEFALGAELAKNLESSFARGPGHGLLRLVWHDATGVLPPTWAWWRDFAVRFISSLCARGEAAQDFRAHALTEPTAHDLVTLIDDAPPMQGAQYLRPKVLVGLWREMARALEVELTDSGLSLQDFLKARDRRWRFVGRVHFNLAENRRDEDFPFAFMATYASGLSASGGLRHSPLGQALKEYAGDRGKLLQLLAPVQEASEACSWLKELVDSGDIFHPLRWEPADAARFLADAETMERAGLVVRMPANWAANRPSRPSVEAVVGAAQPSLLGMDGLLDFDVGVSLDGEALSDAEIDELLAATHGLALLRGKWVEIDAERLRATLEKFQKIKHLSEQEGVPFADAMRMVAGADIGAGAGPNAQNAWARVRAGPWLAKTLEECRSPEKLAGADPGDGLTASLRPYQRTGVEWLYFLTQMGLGACLADDMGLGKTLQVLALLLAVNRKTQNAKKKRPSLLVAPASLLANWAQEAERFAPGLKIWLAHPAFTPAEELRAIDAKRLKDADLVVTSYATLLRLDWIAKMDWRFVILDEAQAIKNPNAKQTKAVKSLKAQARIALTGTPIENNLGDLWSIFDFLNPGLLGSSKNFANFVKRLAAEPHVSFAPLRKLAQPYILRRLKTDKSIIADLPDKTEVKAFCHLSRKQAALYQGAVEELEHRLKETEEGIARSGLVLAFLMRLKQICNHPSQWLGEGAYGEDDSGKFSRLREIAETIASRQEKLLVYSVQARTRKSFGSMTRKLSVTESLNRGQRSGTFSRKKVSVASANSRYVA